MMDPQDDASTVAAEIAQHDDGDTDAGSTRRPVGIWWLLLLLVLLLGYLSAARKESLGRLAEQVADIVRDFRGYDPEF